MFLSLLLALSTSFVSVFSETNVIVPFYIDPSANNGPASWSQLADSLTAHPSLTFYAIINPSSGPLKSSVKDSSYPNAMSTLRSAAATHNNAVFLGYIATGNGDRAPSAVQSDIDSWTAIPELLPDGFFFDEASSLASDSGVYASFASYAISKLPNAHITLNPGAPTTADYFGYSDQIVIYERPPLDTYPGVNGVEPSKFSAIIYSDSQMNETVSTLAGLGYGTVYVTSAGNSYDALGSDWEQFLDVLDGTT
ncbi:MAG: hypothetical protein Q9227_007129 [Pyrenula ochraceoflavens]